MGRRQRRQRGARDSASDRARVSSLLFSERHPISSRASSLLFSERDPISSTCLFWVSDAEDREKERRGGDWKEYEWSRKRKKKEGDP